MIYRKEIDGLRAIAVLPVILYHLNIPYFSGGYIGVDIFFVISGFLISNILFVEIEASSFSILSFYERRIRRILPVLFFVTFISIPFAWYLLAPQYLKGFSQSIVATQLFSSNILFWLTGNYFDTSSDLKPLLHTWSLSVEEQFYMVYPLLIFYLIKIGKKNAQSVILIITTLSLLCADYYAHTSPNTSFYFLHTRAWELLFGGLASIYLFNNGKHHSFEICNAVSLLSLFILFFSFYYFDQTTPTPSFYAIAPTLGTALILIFTKTNTICYKLLTNSILTSIGLISYSAYLWHQPILAFARHAKITELDYAEKIYLLIIIFLFSFLTWKFVERPFRNFNFLTRKKIFTYAAFISILFLCIGLVGHFTDGFISLKTPNYLPQNYFEFYNRAKPLINGADGKSCMSETDSLCLVHSSSLSSSKKILLVGDSHSGDYTNQFREFIISNNYNGFQMSVSGCGFVPSQFHRHNGLCGKSYELLKDYIKNHQIDDVIFITSMYDHVYLKNDLLFTSELLNYLGKNTTRLWIFMPRLTLSNDPLRAANLNLLSQLTFDIPKLRSSIDAALHALEASNNIFIFDEMHYLYKISGKSPILFNAHTTENYPLYIDTNHLNDYSSRLIFSEFIKIYNQNKNY